MKWLFAILTIVGTAVHAQTKTDAVAGVWKGTSLCQVKGSPCHDEVVVYHISPGEKLNSYSILANKIVNGAEEEMGTLPAVYDEKKKLLSAYMKGKPVWNFTVEGKEMNGTLVLPDGTLFRIVKVTKQP